MLKKLGKSLQAIAIKAAEAKRQSEGDGEGAQSTGECKPKEVPEREKPAGEKGDRPVPQVRKEWIPQDESMLLSLPPELLEEILFRTGSATYLRGARAACVQLFNMSVDVTARHFSLPSLDDFDIIAKIGEGSFAKVYQVRYKPNDKIYALKVFKKSGMLARKHLNEHIRMVPLWQQLQHPAFTPLYCAFQDDINVYTVTTCLNGGELFYHLSRVVKFDRPAVKSFAIQLVSALCYAHDKGIILRAIKPEDIVFDRFGRIHLTDFNMSKVIGRERTYTFCGTPEYLAPELLKGCAYDFTVDWWAVGILLYETTVGIPPFYSADVNQMYGKIMTGELTFPAFIDDVLKDLITKLLDRDVNGRLQGHQVKEHPYFQGVDWAKVERGEWSPDDLPFRPNVKDELDLSHFDSLFTQDTAITKASILADPEAKQAPVYFKDFDYRNDEWVL